MPRIHSILIALMVAACGLLVSSPSYALQSGGVEMGDLESGSVVGQGFKDLPIDLDLYAIEIGALKVWYPAVPVLDLKVRPGRPIVIRVSNKSTTDRGFLMTGADANSVPTAMKAEVVLKPGESRFIGVPLSDLLYATSGSTFNYKDLWLMK